MRAIAIIPARYASTRFPGKPLALIGNKPMVQHVYERSKTLFNYAAVATDDHRIANVVESFGGNVVMTSPDHQSGTDRCAEAAEEIKKLIDFDIVVNIQGDEPFFKEEQIKNLLDCFDDDQTDIATLSTTITSSEMLFDSNKVKMVCDLNNHAMYFSRHTIPFQRDNEKNNWIENHNYRLHLGLYAYRAHTLEALTKLKQTPLEMAERLEQLRWLENGYRIKVAHSDEINIGIDTPEDLHKVIRQLEQY
ncbi:MAG: 3-deoxy-manno-octulosonate cytidylyltransferase [Prolixibacteraceae bacterium]|jgi:3-deoxy-manno-octulosonate cytidylyltransferase (CMP-KDO synthetase)|nr:3-deoxy-manno-octulosonate cytidylyltransferase [Prolixibacteraceae bacterium]